MGWFPCAVCGVDLLSAPRPHVCDMDKARARVKELELAARTAEQRLDSIRDSVYQLLRELPSSLPNEGKVEVNATWLRRLWAAAQCRWYEVQDADRFLVVWMGLHRVLCEAFDLFRSQTWRKNESVLARLEALREAVGNAKEVMNYQDSNLDWNASDVLNACREYKDDNKLNQVIEAK